MHAECMCITLDARLRGARAYLPLRFRQFLVVFGQHCLEVDDLKTMIRNNFYLKDKQREPVTPEVELLVGCEERREDLKINHRSSLIIKMRGVLKNCGVKFITLIIKISLFRKWQN